MLIKGQRVTWACAPVVGRPARSGPGISASVARGGRSWRAGSTVSGSGHLRRLRRQAPTGGSGGERCAGEAGEAGGCMGVRDTESWATRLGVGRAGFGPGEGALLAGPARAGPARAGRGRGWAGTGKGRGERGLGRTGPRERMGWVEVFLLLGFLSISYSLLFLIQTSLNSNTNLNSNHTQLKVCTSMNAQQNFLNLNKF